MFEQFSNICNSAAEIMEHAAELIDAGDTATASEMLKMGIVALEGAENTVRSLIPLEKSMDEAAEIRREKESKAFCRFVWIGCGAVVLELLVIAGVFLKRLA